jgi:hypothetical protein
VKWYPLFFYAKGEQEMKTSTLTGKTYDESEAVYMTNPRQNQAYAKYLGGWDFFLDMLFTSEKREDALVFVWKKCPETANAKRLWDNHEI